MRLAPALLLFVTGCWGPDTLELGYGHTWPEDGSAWGVGGSPQVGLGMGESDQAWVAVGWDLGPRRVQIVQQERPWPEPLPLPIPDPEPAREPLDAVEPGPGAVEIIETFDQTSGSTKAIFVIALTVVLVILGAILWVYRKSIGGWIGRK